MGEGEPTPHIPRGFLTKVVHIMGVVVLEQVVGIGSRKNE